MGDPTTEVNEGVLASTLGFMDLLAMALGDRLGYYRSLADRPGKVVRRGRQCHRYR